MKVDLSSKVVLRLVRYIISRRPDLCNRIEQALLSVSGLKDKRSELLDWDIRAYAPPPPSSVKRAILKRHSLPRSIWVETGTLHGDTTNFLSQLANLVYSIEPEQNLYVKAKSRFKDNRRIILINDISENALPALLPTLSGNLCLYLDGHYSAGNTYAGPNDTPLVQELACIKQNISRFNNILICIDDIRLCGSRHVYGDYPSLNYLVDFCREQSLSWGIEQDIFIMKSM